MILTHAEKRICPQSIKHVTGGFRFHMSRWECDFGHILEGIFYTHSRDEAAIKMPLTIKCPQCGYEMTLCREEGSRELLGRVREFIGKTPQHPDRAEAMKNLGKLEVVVRKLSDAANRP